MEFIFVELSGLRTDSAIINRFHFWSDSKGLKMKFIASIELKDGSVITLPLNCREYHANKLQYVFSRTLDRSKVASCSVFAVESAVERPVYIPALKMEVL